MSIAGPKQQATIGSEFEDFFDRCYDGLSHQVRGDAEPFLAMWSHASDVGILGAIGSHAEGWPHVQAHIRGAARSLDWTDLSLERLMTTVSGALAVTVVLEHMSREPEGQRSSRTLRTTQAYRLEAEGWRLILRHANAVSPADEATERAILGGAP